MSAEVIVWISVDKALPPRDPDDEPPFMAESKRVLCRTGGQFPAIHMGYLQYDYGTVYGTAEDQDDIEPPRWKQAGRDGYDLENVTHWAYVVGPNTDEEGATC